MSSVVSIRNGVFRNTLGAKAPSVFRNAVRSLEVAQGQRWAVCGPAKELFLNVLANKYLADPPLSFKYGPSAQDGRVQHLQFKGAAPTAHLSARYEFYKDEFDETCGSFVLDNSVRSHNVAHAVGTTNRTVDMQWYGSLLDQLELRHLADRWVMGLSNGQMRRARLARALLKKPGLLLVDDPFLGLDPDATKVIATALQQYASRASAAVVVGLRPQDAVPQWCSHVAAVDGSGLLFQGAVAQWRDRIDDTVSAMRRAESVAVAGKSRFARGLAWRLGPAAVDSAVPVVALRGVSVAYRGEPVLQDVHWEVRSGDKWHVRGDNGSGKSTLLALLTAEHPQSWNARVVDNGVPRRTGHTSYFEINSRFGVSSPELHAIALAAPNRSLTLQQCLVTGLNRGATASFVYHKSQRLSDSQRSMVDDLLQHFDLARFRDCRMDQLTVSQQKLTLFLRSIIKSPQILILDEAFSAMDSVPMKQCHELLDHWHGTVLVVSHIQQETPTCNKYIHLQSPGTHKLGHV